jgi:hypothetical protein
VTLTDHRPEEAGADEAQLLFREARQRRRRRRLITGTVTVTVLLVVGSSWDSQRVEGGVVRCRR